MAVVFDEIAAGAYVGGDFETALNDGVRDGSKGFLRKSVVRDP
jgi:hypothetical protein